MAGLGYRREMTDWDMSAVQADFFEVVPENWVRRSRDRLHELLSASSSGAGVPGRPVHLHGVSLNLGGTGPINTAFVHELRELMADIGATHQPMHYSDHLAASGDAHQLYDLFPIPFTVAEVARISDRIKQVQDVLGCRMAVENTTWYTNRADMPEGDFLAAVAERADCGILLDLNNIAVNHKNHGGDGIEAFIARIDLGRVTYMHVAGHEFDARFGLYIDTHSQPVEPPTRQAALRLNRERGIPILLEWDNDVPDMATLNQELAWLTPSTTM